MFKKIAALSRQPADAGGWSYQAQNTLARARSKSECVHDYFFKSGLDKGTIADTRRGQLPETDPAGNYSGTVYDNG